MCVCWACFPKNIARILCAAGLPHDTAALRYAIITNMQEMGLACGVTFLFYLMIRKIHYQREVPSQQLGVDVAITKCSGVLSWSRGQRWGKRFKGWRANTDLC